MLWLTTKYQTSENKGCAALMFNSFESELKSIHSPATSLGIPVQLLINAKK